MSSILSEIIFRTRYSEACALETLWMVMIDVSVLLSTTNCCTWREDRPGDPSHEVGDN